MLKVTTPYPTHLTSFWISEGDRPEVRQWLYDNNATWIGSGNAPEDIINYKREKRYLLVRLSDTMGTVSFLDGTFEDVDTYTAEFNMLYLPLVIEEVSPLTNEDVLYKFLTKHRAYSAYKRNNTRTKTDVVDVYIALRFAFLWANVPEGAEYWNGLSNTWQDLVDHFNLTDTVSMRKFTNIE